MKYIIILRSLEKHIHPRIELIDRDKITEKQADRFAAELLLPAEALKDAVMNAFGSSNMRDVTDNRALRFIARIQCDWWLPFQAIINRLFEEGYINVNQYDKLYAIDCRNEDGIYRRLLKNIDSEISELLNKKTKTVGVSNRVIETIISNYEDGLIDDDEFVRTLAMFDKKPEDYGLCMDTEIDDELKDFFLKAGMTNEGRYKRGQSSFSEHNTKSWAEGISGCQFLYSS
mgnify:CR=1 FL=1